MSSNVFWKLYAIIESLDRRLLVLGGFGSVLFFVVPYLFDYFFPKPPLLHLEVIQSSAYRGSNYVVAVKPDDGTEISDIACKSDVLLNGKKLEDFKVDASKCSQITVHIPAYGNGLLEGEVSLSVKAYWSGSKYVQLDDTIWLYGQFDITSSIDKKVAKLGDVIRAKISTSPEIGKMSCRWSEEERLGLLISYARPDRCEASLHLRKGSTYWASVMKEGRYDIQTYVTVYDANQEKAGLEEVSLSFVK